MKRVRSPFAWLACALVLPCGAAEALKPLSDPLLKFIRSEENVRAQHIQNQLLQERSLLGLNHDHGFSILAKSTDEFGKVLVRLQQTYRGIPVWNGRVIGRMEANGSLAPFRTALKPVSNLDVVPRLNTSQIEARIQSLLPQGAQMIRPSRVSLAVLPSSDRDGLKLRRDTTGTRFELDPEFSVAPVQPIGDASLAYQVNVAYLHPSQGPRFVDLMLDANTGAVLKKSDAARYDTAAQGTGHTQFSGDRSLDTIYREATGVYQMVDTTRPVKPNTVFGPQVPEIGNRTFWMQYTIEYQQGGYTRYRPHYPEGAMPFESNLNVWGDGNTYANGSRMDPMSPPTDANAATAAADVHFGIQLTWDMMTHVFNWNGIDGEGGSVWAEMHDLTFPQNAALVDDLLVCFGDGEFQCESLVSLDIVAHELGHGVMMHTGNLAYYSESGGMNESSSDFIGAMATYYKTSYPDGDPTLIPETGGEWRCGIQLGVPWYRRMYKPSLDGNSHDQWFGGVGRDEVHYTSGIGNRFFYFLSQGTDASDPERQSAYLPGGMTGIGNQKTAKIWFRALTNYLVDAYSDYASVREATLLAAAELFPDSSGNRSPEYQAVQNAWAAVNVGAAVGQPDPIRVQFNDISGASGWSDLNFIPFGKKLQLSADAINASDPSTTWSLGGLTLFAPGGSVSETGVFEAPYREEVYSVKASSSKDPKQYAVTLVLPQNIDLDNDGSMDACDMGLIGLMYGKSAYDFSIDNKAIYPDFYRDGTINDLDVSLFVQTFNAGYGK